MIVLMSCLEISPTLLHRFSLVISLSLSSPPLCIPRSLLMFSIPPRSEHLLSSSTGLPSGSLSSSLDSNLMKCSGSRPFPLRVLNLCHSDRDAHPASPETATSTPLQLLTPTIVKERSENLTEKVTQVLNTNVKEL